MAGTHLIINTASVGPRTHGIRRYLLGLVDGLAATEGDWTLSLVCTRRNVQLFEQAALADPNRIKVATAPSSAASPLSRAFFDQFGLLQHLKTGVLITPSGVATLATRTPQICTVQAPLMVSSIRHAAGADMPISWPRKAYYDWGLKATMHKADVVVSVSDFVSQELTSCFPAQGHKIRTIPEGVDTEDFSPTGPFYDIPGVEDYILFLSTLYPYKGADILLAAFALLARSGSASVSHMSLCIAGADPDRQHLILHDKAKALGIADRTVFLGPIDHSTAPMLMRGASVFVYPSKMETFGLPPLEAMACGTPVITSDRCSLPNVVGHAAKVVDCTDYEELAEALEVVLEDTKMRETLKRRGIKRAQDFSWSLVASRYVEIADQVASAG